MKTVKKVRKVIKKKPEKVLLYMYLLIFFLFALIIRDAYGQIDALSAEVNSLKTENVKYLVSIDNRRLEEALERRESDYSKGEKKKGYVEYYEVSKEEFLEKEEEAKRMADKKTFCLSDGGEWKRVGDQGVYQCVRSFTDGGDICAKSRDCEGNCIFNSPDEEPFCQYDDNPFGCFSTVEEFAVVQNIICRD